MSKKSTDVVVVGFALFAMFFGAGNLIFPPYLGFLSGSVWSIAMLGFLITGIGIPLSDLGKLGRAFEQVENQFTKTKSGSGLGLAISKSLVEMHGGTLEIASQIGKGTTVTISLPMRVGLDGQADTRPG